MALIGAAAAHAAVFHRAVALGAVGPGVAHLKQVIEAAILGREAVLELAERVVFMHIIYCICLHVSRG